MKISKDIPLAEITLRKYERPYEMPRRELIRKVCLSAGLLHPGDSRDVIVDIFQILLEAKEPLSCEKVRDLVVQKRQNEKLPLNGIAPSNIRRQIRRLRELYFVQKKQNTYFINENEDISVLFTERIENFFLPSILSRVKEYIKALR